jgi:hypothetical protein
LPLCGTGTDRPSCRVEQCVRSKRAAAIFIEDYPGPQISSRAVSLWRFGNLLNLKAKSGLNWLRPLIPGRGMGSGTRVA